MFDYQHCSKYLTLCSEEERTAGDIIFIFERTVSLIKKNSVEFSNFDTIWLQFLPHVGLHDLKKLLFTYFYLFNDLIREEILSAPLSMASTLAEVYLSLIMLL